MRRAASSWAAGFGPEMAMIPVLKRLLAWKAEILEAIGQAEGGPAGWLSVARLKRMTR